MALPDSLKIVKGTQIVLAQATDFASKSLGQPAHTDELNVENLASGSYRQSAKFDLGSANLDVLYAVNAWMEFFSAPTAYATVEFWVGFSSSATAGTDNPGNLSGADAAYNGYGAAATDADECIGQLVYIGSMILSADIDVHVAEIGTFRARDRYACLVVKNNAGVAIAATDANETCVVITPLTHQVQD